MIEQEALFYEMEAHLLQDSKPSKYLERLYYEPILQKPPFDRLYQLKKTEQSAKHHPEGNVWNHTMMVVDEAAKVREKSNNPRVFMWSALLHDIGKPMATQRRKGRITAYNHDKIGAELVEEFLMYFTNDKRFIQEVAALVRYHMQILYVINNFSFSDIKGMKRDTDIQEVALLGLCDRLGRGNSNQRLEEKHIQQFLNICE